MPIGGQTKGGLPQGGAVHDDNGVNDDDDDDVNDGPKNELKNDCIQYAYAIGKYL